MGVVAEPNWLIVIGLVYMAYAFGLLGLSALSHGVTFDPVSKRASDSKQRVAQTFAGITGLVGASMQALGQFVHLGEGLAVVVMLLGLIVLLLSYLTFSGRMAKLSERMVEVTYTANILPIHAQPLGVRHHAAE